MAQDKKSFLLYCDIIHTVTKLTDVDAGQLFKHMLNYVNDLNPTTENMIVDIAFEPIKQQLKRDLKKYESIKELRSKAGKVSAERKAENKQVLTCVENVKQILTHSTVNDIDIDIDSVIDNNIRDKKRFIPPAIEEVKRYCLERNNNVNPQKWHDHYTSNGWMVGKSKMKDWKAAVRTWENEIKTKKTNNYEIQ